jgi:heptosyltransferase-2
VLSPNWLGDAVMALPAIDDLRRHVSGARVIVAARRSVAGLFALVPWVDEIVELEWRGRVADAGAMWSDVRRLRASGADAALLLPNSFASAWLAFAARVPERWGYARDGRSWLLTRAPALPVAVARVPSPDSRAPSPEPRAPSPEPRVPNPPPSPLRGSGETGPDLRSVHQGAYYQHLVHSLGAPNGRLEPRISVPAGAFVEAEAVLAAAGRDANRPLVVFAPGAAYGTAKRWWPSHFAQLAADVIRQHDAQVVLVGSGADAATTEEIVGLVPGDTRQAVLDLAGRTTLASLAAVMTLARVCVSNDSGAMHLAAAAGVPLAAIFGPTNERETAPLTHAPLDLLIHDVPCRPCMLRECPIDHPCMRDLAPARVLASVNRLLLTDRMKPEPEASP